MNNVLFYSIRPLTVRLVPSTSKAWDLFQCGSGFKILKLWLYILTDSSFERMSLSGCYPLSHFSKVTEKLKIIICLWSGHWPSWWQSDEQLTRRVVPTRPRLVVCSFCHCFSIIRVVRKTLTISDNKQNMTCLPLWFLLTYLWTTMVIYDKDWAC